MTNVRHKLDNVGSQVIGVRSIAGTGARMMEHDGATFGASTSARCSARGCNDVPYIILCRRKETVSGAVGGINRSMDDKVNVIAAPNVQSYEIGDPLC